MEKQRRDIIGGEKKTIKDVSDTPIFDEEKMTEIMRQIGKNVRKYRNLRGYQATELAEVSNICIPYIYKMEKGQAGDFKVSTLIKLALALNISLDDLISLEYQTGTQESLGRRIDALTQDCDIVTKNMILKSANALIDLSKVLIQRGVLDSAFAQEVAGAGERKNDV